MNETLIFFVDDDKLILNLMEYTFNNREGCKVMCFRSGEECIAQMHLRPTMVVLDFFLSYNEGGLSGKEVLQHIVKQQPDIPVVIFSGQENQKVIKELLDLGAWKFIKKDAFFIDTIMESIRELPRN
jgi:DNA-binding NtrC family response regulator